MIDLSVDTIAISQFAENYTDQESVIGFDDFGHILFEWDDGRGLNLIPSVDK